MAKSWRIAVIVTLLIAASGATIVHPLKTSAAQNNCGYIACSYYTSRQEVRLMRSLAAAGASTENICYGGLARDRSGTLGSCLQFTFDPFSKMQLRRVIERAYSQNACIKFYSPAKPPYGTVLVQSIDPYNGQYCRENA